MPYSVNNTYYVSEFTVYDLSKNIACQTIHWSVLNKLGVVCPKNIPFKDLFYFYLTPFEGPWRYKTAIMWDYMLLP